MYFLLLKKDTFSSRFHSRSRPAYSDASDSANTKIHTAKKYLLVEEVPQRENN